MTKGAIQVQLSGKVAVTVGGTDVELGSNKAQTVFVALALAGGSLVPVDRLITLVWEDDAPRTAEKTLQTYITRLRTLCGIDSIERVGAAYRLHVDPESVDLVQFEALLDREDLPAALVLWKVHRLPALLAEASHHR